MGNRQLVTCDDMESVAGLSIRGKRSSVVSDYSGSHLQRVKDAKETACCKWVFIATELFNIVVNYFDAKKSAPYSRVLVVTELVSGTQCILGG